MSFIIDNYLDSATQDKELRQKIICIHDDLYTAYPSETVLLAIFSELRRQNCG